jgi:hypothetical protein
VAAVLAGAPAPALHALEGALARAYQPADQWAILARLRSLAQEHGWRFSSETAALLTDLARLSASPDQRRQALELLARFCGPAGSAPLARAAQADADPSVRACAAELLQRT